MTEPNVASSDATNVGSRIERYGNNAVRIEIAMIKVAAPSTACQVMDSAIQAHGGAGMCSDFPLAHAYVQVQALRLADGPDELHRNQVARLGMRAQRLA